MKTERVPIDSVQFDPANVRRHGEKNLATIKASLARFGQQKPLVVDADGVVRAGNGTLAAAKALGWKEVTIVRTDLRGAEATAYAIADNRTAELAEWDDDALAQTLAALQIEDDDLAIATGFDLAEIEDLVDGNALDDKTYTAKIAAPIYEQRGERPKTSELVNRNKTDELLKQIAQAEIQDDIRQFLAFAAERHTVFDFRRIAEFYAHADEMTQDLMERSALVIIDFDKAIENGFVRLNETLGKLTDRDEANA